ncbi:hypothetical protein L3X38_043537 [Prunus dulcis]|uniref:Uncharacterized protein n=1 Tax=Prunus dulcis TaxID=3755 RepID=A0AAD4YM83_PRUDU|nr:hypothetical protein L3X38_043537 [Prunus dulcis]
MFAFQKWCDVTVVALKPNHKVNISYNNLQATVFYATDSNRSAAVLLATKPVPPPSFRTTKAQTTHHFRVEIVSAYVGDEVAREISEGRARGGVTFELKMLGTPRVKKVPECLRLATRLSSVFPGELDRETDTSRSVNCMRA